jgi:hypothetical protein
MNTKKIAIASTVGVFAVMALLFAYPAMASSVSTPQRPNLQQLLVRSAYMNSQTIQLSNGQTITLTSVAGGYWVIGNRDVNGTASGSLAFQVSSALTGGYVLTVTGGSLTINGSTYAVSSGSAMLGPHGVYVVGNGQAGNAQFLFLDRDLGRFGSTNYGVLRVDLKDGASEFGVRLLVTISA